MFRDFDRLQWFERFPTTSTSTWVRRYTERRWRECVRERRQKKKGKRGRRTARESGIKESNKERKNDGKRVQK